jgi:hypothetical protein
MLVQRTHPCGQDRMDQCPGGIESHPPDLIQQVNPNQAQHPYRIPTAATSIKTYDCEEVSGEDDLATGACVARRATR